jgi:hypothetical protein
MGATTVPQVSLRSSLATQLSTLDPVLFDTEDYDTDGMHDTVTNTGRITIKTPGLYWVRATVQWTTAEGQAVWVSKNGGATPPLKNEPTGSQNRYLSTQGLIRCAAGDYLTVGAFSSVGGTNIKGGAGSYTQFEATWIGGAGQTIDERGVPAAKVYGSAHTAVPTGTAPVLSFDSESLDTDGMHDPTTNNSRITIKTPGLYLIGGTINWPNNTNGQREIVILKNGAAIAASDMNAGGNINWQQVSVVAMLAAGDYLEFMVFQNSGASLTPTAGADKTFFTADLIGSGKTVTPFVRAYKTLSTQSVPDGGTDVAVSFDAEESDNDGIHDNATNNTRFVCRTAGVYAIHANVTFSANATGARWLQIRKNGSTHIEQRIINATGDARDTAVEISCLAELAVGDYLELVVTVTGAGGSLTLTGGQNGRGNKFEMVKIGAPLAGQTGMGPAQAEVFTVATLPAANTFPNGRIVGVSDGAAGQQARMAMNGAWINLG